MKKIFTLICMVFITMNVNAQNVCTDINGTTKHLVSDVDDSYVYTTDFSTDVDEDTGNPVARNGEKIVGNGQFVSTNEEGAIFDNYFQNDGSAVRSSYCLLPEDVLAHSSNTHELTIAFWVCTEGFTPEQYAYSPIFSAYAAKNTPNSWPMLVLQSRGSVQVNCSGWCDFTSANNVAGKNNVYNNNAWEASSNAYNYVNNWLEDQKWHYYTAVFTNTNAKIFLDGEVKNEWNVDGTSDGQVISGLFSNGADLKYVCLGGTQAWDWNDNDAPFRFARLLIKNKSMTADEIKEQMTIDFPDWRNYLQGQQNGIESISVNTNSEKAVTYNIAGQKVNDDYRGLCIQNGKKYISVK